MVVKNPLKYDPSRTITLRRKFAQALRKRFMRFRMDVVRLVRDEDAFGLRTARDPRFVRNVFCPTGEGGGVDPSCSPSGGGKVESAVGAVRSGWKQELKQLWKQHADSMPGDESEFEEMCGLGLCEVASRRLKEVLADEGVKADVVHGSYDTPGQDHTWLITQDGTVIDGTESQYSSEVKLGDVTVHRPGSPRHRLYKDGKLAVNTRWKFETDKAKVKLFQAWLRRKLRAEVLGVTEDALWAKYVEEGFRRGAGRAFDDVQGSKRFAKDQGAFYEGSKRQFLKSAFGRPESVAKVKLLAGRTYTDLEGVTEAMSRKMTRALVNGLVRGMNPNDIAAEMSKAVDLEYSRAVVISRTECLPAGTPVDGAVVRAAFRRWYVGDMVEVTTAGGRKFSATPNHPMLSTRGWLGAGSLREGDHLVCSRRQEHPGPAGDGDVDDRPTTIGEVFDSLRAVGVCERTACAEHDFHGDGTPEGEVDTLRPDRPLRIGRFAPIFKPTAERFLTPAALAGASFCHLCSRLLPVNGSVCLCLGAELDPLGSDASAETALVEAELPLQRLERFPVAVPAGQLVGVNVGAELVGDPSTLPGGQLCLTGVPNGATVLAYYGEDPLGAVAELPGDLLGRDPGAVELDQVLLVTVRKFAGHVYNLETPYGYFTIDSLYTGNTIAAHAEGQLLALEEMGVEEVGVAIEWSTAGDDRVCPLCSEMEGVVLKLEEAHGKIPLHPQCRCAWLPANVGEDQNDQKRSQAAIRSAVQGVGRRGGDEEWVDEFEVSKDRPEPLVNEFSSETVEALVKLG